MTEEFRFFACIVYDRKDEKWAKWLRRNINGFRIPEKLRREQKTLPRRVKAALFGEAERSSQAEGDRMLIQSEYLVVVCSPDSRNSEVVNQTIRRFREFGREENLVLLLVSPEPAFPEALFDLGEMEILASSIHELGKNNAFLRVMATMLKIDYDKLVKRDARRRRRKAALLLGFLLAAALATGAGSWYLMPHNAYYDQITYRYEIPTGINRISKEVRKQRYGCYRITTQRGRVIQAAYVNSQDLPLENTHPYLDGDLMWNDYFYNEDGTISKCILRLFTGEILQVRKYSGDGKIVDLYADEDCLWPAVLPADLLENSYVRELHAESEEMSGVRRMVLSYDAQGFTETEKYYIDNRFTAACDKNGIYGKRYVRNAEGLAEEIQYLDKDYETVLAADRYTYDACGRAMEKQITSYGLVDVRYGYELSRDSLGNCLYGTYLNENGEPAFGPEGYAAVAFSFGDNGYLESLCYRDREGNPIFSSEDLISMIKFAADENGRISELSYYDTDGNPCSCKDGYALMKVVRDASGEAMSSAYYHSDGSFAYNLETEEKSCLSEVQYSEDRKTATILSYKTDEKGQLMLSGQERESFNERGLITRVDFLDAAGEADRKKAFASICLDYDDVGHRTEVQLLDADGNRTSTNWGYSISRYQYDLSGNRIGEAYFNVNGEAISNADGFYHDKQMTYDSEHRMLTLVCRDQYGMQCDYEERYEYDERGNRTRVGWYNPNGELICNDDGYAEKICVYNEAGKLRSVSFYDELSLPVTNGISEQFFEYDADGMRSSAVTVSWKDGERVYQAEHYTYDPLGRVISTEYCNEEGELSPNPDGVVICEKEYNSAGQMILQRDLGEGMELLLLEEIKYDSILPDRVSAVKLFSGEDPDGYLTTYTYDEIGDLTEKWYLDAEGNHPIIPDGSDCVGIVYHTDYENFKYSEKYYLFDSEKVYESREKMYDLDRFYTITGYSGAEQENENESYTTDRDDYGTIRYVHYQKGEQEEDRYFLYYVSSLEEDSEAYRKGIREGDNIIAMAGWNYDRGKDSYRYLSSGDFLTQKNIVDRFGGSLTVLGDRADGLEFKYVPDLKDLQGVTVSLAYILQDEYDRVIAALEARQEENRETAYYLENEESSLLGYMAAMDKSSFPVFGNDAVHRSDICAITFTDQVQEANETAWDVSVNKDRSVLAWLVPEMDRYHLYVGAEQKIHMNETAAGLFAGYDYARSIEFNDWVDTASCLNMSGLFYGCRRLRALDLSAFETEQVTDMSNMFSHCEKLEDIVLSTLRTPNVTNMSYMFFLCSGIKTLNFSGFDVSGVYDFGDMFAFCSELEEVDLTDWMLIPEEVDCTEMFMHTFLEGLEEESLIDGLYRKADTGKEEAA